MYFPCSHAFDIFKLFVNNCPSWYIWTWQIWGRYFHKRLLKPFHCMLSKYPMHERMFWYCDEIEITAPLTSQEHSSVKFYDQVVRSCLGDYKPSKTGLRCSSPCQEGETRPSSKASISRLPQVPSVAMSELLWANNKSFYCRPHTLTVSPDLTDR